MSQQKPKKLYYYRQGLKRLREELCAFGEWNAEKKRAVIKQTFQGFFKEWVNEGKPRLNKIDTRNNMITKGVQGFYYVSEADEKAVTEGKKSAATCLHYSCSQADLEKWAVEYTIENLGEKRA